MDRYLNAKMASQLVLPQSNMQRDLVEQIKSRKNGSQITRNESINVSEYDSEKALMNH